MVPSITYAERPSTPIEIWIVSSLLGYVEPCGCTIDVMLGGIDRLVGVTKKQVLTDIDGIKVVSGPTFYDPEAPAHRRKQDHLKANLIASALKSAGFDYSVPSLPQAELLKAIGNAESKANLRSVRQPTLIEYNGYKNPITKIIIPAPKKTNNNSNKNISGNFIRQKLLINAIGNKILKQIKLNFFVM